MVGNKNKLYFTSNTTAWDLSRGVGVFVSLLVGLFSDVRLGNIEPDILTSFSTLIITYFISYIDLQQYKSDMPFRRYKQPI